MKAIEYRFIEPVDALFLRSNKLFGDPGSFGECQIPPWPSVAAGAIRSRMLVDKQINLKAFTTGKMPPDPELGTPKQPGSFVLVGFYLARKNHDGGIEVLLPAPADLIISKTKTSTLDIRCLLPQRLPLASSYPLEMLPVLAQGPIRTKPASGYWLTQSGWAAYQRGETPKVEQLIHASELWSLDARVGIGMNLATRSAQEGRLFSAQALVLHKKGQRLSNDRHSLATMIDYDVGFLAAVQGAKPATDGVLRFGGDGRAVTIESAQIQLPEPDYEAIVRAKRCRILLTSPGLFPGGWQLPVTDDHHQLMLGEGVRAKVVAAAVAAPETVSGWDLAKGQPKLAQHLAPAGSVYWLDQLEASADALRRLVDKGLWVDSSSTSPDVNSARRAEGFNRFCFASWL